MKCEVCNQTMKLHKHTIYYDIISCKNVECPNYGLPMMYKGKVKLAESC